LARLAEVLLVEGLRSTGGKDLPPGLLRGLADTRIAEALRQIHADPQRSWTMAGLAGEAGMSRSAFFDRFTRLVGRSPMDYLLAW
ncbi:AraC family transcriptional regulator, partial [Rhizobiaceae sp. 2RAB30]